MVPDQIDSLIRIWESRDPVEWESDPERYLAFGKQAIARGRPGLAFDILSEGRAAFPGHRELRYVSALALAKSGTLGHAAQLVRDLLAEPDLDARLCSDSLSLAGRIAKDRWARLPPGPGRTTAGDEARSHYQRAFSLSRDPFPGINAATMCALTGYEEQARRLAEEVRKLCAEAGSAAQDGHWLQATHGEACLILDHRDAARECYARAVHQAGRNFGDIASMRRQVRLLAAKFEYAHDILLILVVPAVAVFAGHMIDRPGRGVPRFQPHLEPRVRAAIAAALADHDVGLGYSSAACGGDIVFAEQMLEREAEVNIVLPFARADFLDTSVRFAGREWVERFDRVLARAASVSYCVEENHLGDDVLFAHAGMLVQGLAVLRGAQLETKAIMLALLDPEAHAMTGGTAASLKAWHGRGRESVVLDLRSLQEREPAHWSQPRAAAADTGMDAAIPDEGLADIPRGRRQVKTMLFADIVGYSRLREHDTPRFFVQFLNAVDAEIGASRVPPAFGNTWGDGLYLVFDDAEDGADFALRLRDAIAGRDWGAAGLPEDMNVRIGMHTGPVFRILDPIIRRASYFGSHVTRAARIEPVATPGGIYITEQMAAALAASGSGKFACDYLGPLYLAKGYGLSRLYRLRRALDSE